jgi:hypothetical protein
VDGGAYDIDWDNARNIVQRNYAHETEGYCVAVFAAGYTTSDGVVRDNLCINNGVSPRLAALQGAVYLHTWNDGPIRGLQFVNNTIQWNPPVADAAAVVSDALFQGPTPVFAHNRIESTTPLIYTSNTRWNSAENTYALAGDALFTVGEHALVPLSALQADGLEKGSKQVHSEAPAAFIKQLRIDSTLDAALDGDGLLNADARAQLLVLRSLAGQYGLEQLSVRVHLRDAAGEAALTNPLLDLQAVYPGVLHFDRDAQTGDAAGTLRLLSADGKTLQQWNGYQNAATLGAAVRTRLGAPSYAHMQPSESAEENQ